MAFTKNPRVGGVIERRRSGRGHGWTYHLTLAGREFAPLIEALGVWGQRWSRRELARHERNLTLLIWAMELRARPAVFGERRCVVKITFTDQPEATRHFWFINEHGRADVCVKDPGFEVDLYIATTLSDMIYIYRGDVPLTRALERRRLQAHGVAWARHQLSAWMPRSPFADVKSLRTHARAA